MDGKRSVRSLTGLRRDSEVLYAGSYETQAGGNVNHQLHVYVTIETITSKQYNQN
jgi:hypothetical protein